MKTMKHFSILLTSVAFVTGCGQMKQNPVSDLDKMRENGGKEAKQTSSGPTVITKEIIVEKPVEVVRTQEGVDASSIVINPDLNIRFIEGQPGSFQIRALATVKDVKTRLVGRNLPDGAVLKPSEKEANVYVLSWTAPIGTVPARDAVKIASMKFTLEIVEAKDAKIRDSLQGLVRDREVSVLILHDQAPPSDLKIDQLPDAVNEGSQTAFEVTVKVPGIDDRTEQKPQLRISFDGGSLAGINYLELDGSRHVLADLAKKEAQYLGDSKWKFSMVFDTKNIPVQPELALDGKPVPDAEATHVRLTFKVYSPFGSATPDVTKRLKIVRQKTEAGQ